MPSETLIQVSGLSKKFCRNLRRSLSYGMQDLAGELVGHSGDRTQLRRDEFWSLRDVSFSVRRGEMLALIGENGAGKSTLLKMINGLMRPDEGTLSIQGRVQALIELGAGFSPVLSGRENVFVNAAVLGIDKRHVNERMPEILEFAGLGDFIDAPVQTYSSGMKARLGFAVVTELDPDVLLIDEVLAVGDTAFQEKCMRRMDALRQSDRAILFVTHSLYQVEALCDTALWLDKGAVVRYGAARDVVRAYLDYEEDKAVAESAEEGVDHEGRVTAATKAYFSARDASKGERQSDPAGHPQHLIRIDSVEVLDSDGKPTKTVPFLGGMAVRISCSASRPIESPLFNFRVVRSGVSVLECSMLIDGHGPDFVDGKHIVECWIPTLPLTPKVYDLLVWVRSAEGIADIAEMRTYARFRVTDEGVDAIPLRGPMALNHLRQGSPVYVPRTWRFYQDGRLLAMVESGPAERT